MQTAVLSAPLRRHDAETVGFGLWVAALWAAFDLVLLELLPRMLHFYGRASGDLPGATFAAEFAADAMRRFWFFWLPGQSLATLLTAMAFAQLEGRAPRRRFGWLCTLAMCGLLGALLLCIMLPGR